MNRHEDEQAANGSPARAGASGRLKAGPEKKSWSKVEFEK